MGCIGAESVPLGRAEERTVHIDAGFARRGFDGLRG